MAIIQKGNKQLTVSSEMVATYLAEGYDEIGENGAVVTGAVAQKIVDISKYNADISVYQTKVKNADAEIAALKQEIEKSNAEIVGLKQDIEKLKTVKKETKTEKAG